MTTLYCDLETFSEADLKKTGSHAYAAHPSSRVLLWGYAVNEEPAKVWDVTLGGPMPEDLKHAAELVTEGKATQVWQNGAMFDQVFLHYTADKFRESELIRKLAASPLEDTMVLAFQASLPGSLSGLCKVFKLPEDKAKDVDGLRLIQKFCKPTVSGRVRDSGTDPEDWAKFVNYCRLDIVSMREVYHRLPRFNRTLKEKELQELDIRINRRGIFMDTALMESAIVTAEKNRKALDAETSRLTGGKVSSAQQRDALLKYIREDLGFPIEDLTKATVERHLKSDKTPQNVKKILTLRLRTAKNSVAKFTKLRDALVDGRLKGSLQFRGASRTGRYSGKIFQPHNLPRPIMETDEISWAIEAVKGGYAHLIWDNVGEALADCLRGLIIAPEGKKFCVADYSNIEGRVLAWLAGEEWKLKAFRDKDAGIGQDLYKLTYGKAFGIRPEDVTKKQRQMGKVLELAMGYQGGPGAFVQFADGYSLDLDTLAAEIRSAIPPVYWDISRKSYEWVNGKEPIEMNPDNWIAFNAVKEAWRAANPRIVQFWSDVGCAAVEAIKNEGVVVRANKRISMRSKGGYLLIRLPSGRFLSYPSPRLPAKGERCDFTYADLNERFNRWERTPTYAGKIAENCVQAVACDILMEAGPRLEKAGYRIVLSVHDEYICEVCDDETRNHRQMAEIMSELPPWAEGLPLSAEGFDAYRYRK